jgi:hypothetical protein
MSNMDFFIWYTDQAQIISTEAVSGFSLHLSWVCWNVFKLIYKWLNGQLPTVPYLLLYYVAKYSLLDELFK